MKKVLCLITFIVVSFTITFAQTPSQAKPAQNPKVVTAAQVNGVYRYYKSEFRVLALGHNKLKVQFDGIYMTLAKSPNMGYAMGEATIEGNVAIFVPPDTQGCKITMTFLPGKIVVKQDGSDADCGFGHNVYTTGTYGKIRSGKPKFEPPP
ncbi:MAG: hypothetical protein AUJ04_06750 [Acidobacteria bacterium 13_1_40CM_3_55_6]|nr:MAG: hypothetical protein AUJ04_06750 [Acidobacteria bacterium 13_1_40CM_3_55_6]